MGYIKTVALLKRKAGMSFEEFQQYYEEHHSQLARRVPGLAYYVRRYVQPTSSGREDTEVGFDVITELWYASEEDFALAKEALREPSFRQEVRDDEECLFDTSASQFFVVDERESDFIPMRQAVVPAS